MSVACVVVKGVDEEVKVERCDVGVGDEDVCRSGEGCPDMRSVCLLPLCSTLRVR